MRKTMKTVGLVGGLSWRTTADYYERICQRVNQHFDNNTNPPLWIYTLDQRQIHDLQLQDDWPGIAERLLTVIQEMETLDHIEAVALLSNTPHETFETLQPQMRLPLLHIGDALGQTLKTLKIKHAGLLGTQYTMEKPFIKDWLAHRYDVVCRVPPKAVREHIQDFIYHELSLGVYSEQARERLSLQIEAMIEQGAEAIILGCTDLPPLLDGAEFSVPLINSTECHANAIADFILHPDQMSTLAQSQIKA